MCVLNAIFAYTWAADLRLKTVYAHFALNRKISFYVGQYKMKKIVSYTLLPI